MPIAAVDQIISDAEMLTMAERRIANHDFGYTAEQYEQRRTSQLAETKNISPQIIGRGVKTADGSQPVRFKLVFKSDSLNDQLLPAIIVDAWFKKDDFGTWSLTWKYNVDQSLALRADQQKALDKLGKSGIDIDLVNSIPDILKRSVFPAQVQFQAGNYEDLNGNGIGDFAGDLDILCGARLTKGGEKLGYLDKKLFDKLTSSNVRYKCFVENERGFYAFMESSLTGEIFLMCSDGQVNKISERVMPKSLEEAKVIAQKNKH
jgi:hypothetical protein